MGSAAGFNCNNISTNILASIFIPSQEDLDPHAEWAQQLEEQEQYEAQDGPAAGDSDGGE